MRYSIWCLFTGNPVDDYDTGERRFTLRGARRAQRQITPLFTATVAIWDNKKGRWV